MRELLCPYTKQRKSIMIVDDDYGMLKRLSRSLIQEGYMIEVFSNPVEALHELQTNSSAYSVVILDMLMPEMHGIEFLEKMKSHPKTEDIPVIVQTCDPSSRDASLTMGISHYLTKPYRPSALKFAVAKLYGELEEKNRLIEEYLGELDAFKDMVSGHFRLHDIKDVMSRSRAISRASKKPAMVSRAITEFMVNAIKHGGSQPVDVYVEVKGGHAHILIKDHGEGFDWRKYTDNNPSHLFDALGHGISYARCMGIDDLTYNEKGNEVRFSFECA